MQFSVRSNLTAKTLAGLALVALGDWLFWIGDGVGSNLGWFALAWAAVTLAMTPPAWRKRSSLIAAVCAVVLAAILSDSPNLIALALFWMALTSAALLTLVDFDHIASWALRLLMHGVVSIIGPWRDLALLRSGFGDGNQLRRLLLLLPLPLGGTAIFLALFAAANPVISDALSRPGTPFLDMTSLAHLVFWALLFTLVWGTLRPRRFEFPEVEPSEAPVVSLPTVPTASVLLALLAFNALFALQNGLDLAFLWSGAPLPGKITMADYAHRGAYPLILTALLAGLFVLVTLRPGSETARVPAIRVLVVLWIAQNIFLVASSALRTIDYIESYSLTELRIAALLWMALVAVGLVLILWRMLRGHRARWLINANAAAALLLLIGSSAVDFGAVAATWNTHHAREVGGKGVELDLCYLNQLGPSSLTALIALERRGGLQPAFAERVASVRHRVLMQTLEAQRTGSWTWRNARRVDQMLAMLHGEKLAAPPRGDRGCDGGVMLPPETSTFDPMEGRSAALTNASDQ